MSRGIAQWGSRSSRAGDGRYAQVGWFGGCPFGLSDRSVEVEEFLRGGVAAGLQAVDFAEPSVYPGFLDAFVEVADDFSESIALFGVHSEHRASDAGVLVLAGGSVGASAGSEFEFALVEVLVELGPFLVCGFAILSFGAEAAAIVEEGSVGADQVVLEDGQVVLGGVEARVPEQLGGDVDRETAGDGVGGEHSAEVVRCVAQRRAGAVGDAGAVDSGLQQPVDAVQADDG